MKNHIQITIHQTDPSTQTPTSEPQSDRNCAAPQDDAANPFAMRLGIALIQWDDPDFG